MSTYAPQLSDALTHVHTRKRAPLTDTGEQEMDLFFPLSNQAKEASDTLLSLTVVRVSFGFLEGSE